MKTLTLIFLLVFIAATLIAATLFVVAWLLAEFKARSFNNECIYLDQLIKRSNITPGAYEGIANALNDLEPYSEADKKRKKSLWSGFEYKFKRYMPFNVTFSDGDIWQCNYMEVIGNIYENPELL